MRCFFCGSLFLEGQDEKALSELLSSGTAQTVKDFWHIGEHELAGTSPRKRERVNPGGAAFIVFSRSLVQSIPVSRTPGFLLGCSLRNLSQNDMSTGRYLRMKLEEGYGDRSGSLGYFGRSRAVPGIEELPRPECRSGWKDNDPGKRPSLVASSKSPEA